MLMEHLFCLFLIAAAAGTDPTATGIWTATPWSQCSSPCSSGVAYRDVQCRSRLTNKIIESNLCVGDPPSQKRFCSSFECQWGCKPGSLQPICLTASLKQVDDGFCNGNTHPGNFIEGFVCPYNQPTPWLPPEPRFTASNQSASPPSYSWAVLTPFSLCTPRCGPDRFSWRSISCVTSAGDIADDLDCSREPPPNRLPCPGAVECQVDAGRCRNNNGDEVADYWCLNKTGIGDWRVKSDWSSCSIPTWLMSTRRVACQDDGNCTDATRPPTIGSCPWLPPLTYYQVGQASDLCTSACGPSVVSNSYQCRFQDVDIGDEYCRAAGIPEPIAIPCRTQACISKKSCSLHARLNISIPIGAFPSIASVQQQLELDLRQAVPNATGVVVSQIRSIGAQMVEAEFSVLCHGMTISAADAIQMQMLDPESAFRRGMVTRGSSPQLQILSAVPDDLVSPPVDDELSSATVAAATVSNTFPTIHPMMIYIAVAVFVVVFVFIRIILRKATDHVKAKAQAPICTRFSVLDLETSMPPIQKTTLMPAPRTNQPGSPRSSAAARIK